MSNQTLKNKIINGDSLKELKKIPDETFDLSGRINLFFNCKL